MLKDDVVAAQLAAVQAGEIAAIQGGLGACFDAGLSSAPVVQGGFTQEQMDAAVQAARDGDAAILSASQAADAQALSDAQAKAVSDLAALQVLLDAAVAQDVVDKAAVQNLSGSVAQVQAALDAIKALLSPPAPVSP